jgi:hypothetical protein
MPQRVIEWIASLALDSNDGMAVSDDCEFRAYVPKRH